MIFPIAYQLTGFPFSSDIYHCCKIFTAKQVGLIDFVSVLGVLGLILVAVVIPCCRSEEVV